MISYIMGKEKKNSLREEEGDLYTAAVSQLIVFSIEDQLRFGTFLLSLWAEKALVLSLKNT